MKVTTFVLPYHVHSFQATQVVPYLQDVCASDASTCKMEQYAELCWKNLDWALGATNISEDQFVAGWAKTVSSELSVPEQDILNLFKRTDEHDTNWRVRENWKYGASVGISGAPQAFVNGVFIETYPTSADEWDSFFKDLLAPQERREVKFMQN